MAIDNNVQMAKIEEGGNRLGIQRSARLVALKRWPHGRYEKVRKRRGGEGGPGGSRGGRSRLDLEIFWLCCVNHAHLFVPPCQAR